MTPEREKEIREVVKFKKKRLEYEAALCPPTSIEEELLAELDKVRGERDDFINDHSIIPSMFISNREELTRLRTQNQILREALEKATRYIAGMQLSNGQHVKQLDGSVKYEQVKNYTGKLYDECKEALTKAHGIGVKE